MIGPLDAATRMKRLSDDDRREAIDAAPNCLGFERFARRAKQVQLADAYRRPAPMPEGGPPLRHA